MSNLNADKVEALVWDEVVRQFSDEQKLTEKLQNRETDALEARRKADEELTALYAVQGSLKRESDKILELYKRDLIDPETLQEQLRDIKRRQDATKGAIEEVRAVAAATEATGADAVVLEHLILFARTGLPHLTWEQKREFLEAIDFKGIVDGKKIELTGLVTDKVLDLDKRGDDSEKDALLCKAGGPEALGWDTAPAALCGNS